MARKQKKITLTAAARELNVSQPTLSAWEGERKNPSVDSLIRMSGLYGVSVDYLLGLPAERYHRADLLQPIPVEILPLFHETPVFSIDRGWAMVDAIEGVLHFADGALSRSQKWLILATYCRRRMSFPVRSRRNPCAEMNWRPTILCGSNPFRWTRICVWSSEDGIMYKHDSLRTKWGSVSILISMIPNGWHLQTDRK